MVRIVIQDASNSLMLSEGHVPAANELAHIFPGVHRYQGDAQHRPSNDEDGRAWIITSYAQRLAKGHGYRLGIDPPLETWLISRSTDAAGELAEWFDGMTDDSYRLMIHRTPCPSPDAWFERAWDHVHERLKLRSRQGRYAHLMPAATRVLSELLEAYQGSHEVRLTVLDGIGHPYVYSLGLAAP